MRCSSLVLAGAVLLSEGVGRAGDGPVFSFDVTPRPERIEVAPGAAFTLDFQVTLRTTKNPSDTGAQGWTFGLVSDGITVVDVSTAGTFAASIHDDPPGLMDTGFVVVEVGTRGTGECVDRTSALSSIVLSFIRDVTLPADGVAEVARVTFAGVGPAEVGDALPVSVFFLDGCEGGG